MTRSDILSAATACVTADRNNTYGPPEDSFAVIGQYWSVYLGVEVNAAQVGTLLALMKLARAQSNPGHADTWVDLAGYAACAGEIATKETPADLLSAPLVGYPPIGKVAAHVLTNEQEKLILEALNAGMACAKECPLNTTYHERVIHKAKVLLTEPSKVTYSIPVSAVVPQFDPDLIRVVCADEEPLNQPKPA